MSFFDDAISTIGRGLAQTATKAFSDATGYNIGGTINFLFGDDQKAGGENLDKLINTIDEKFTGPADQLKFLNDTLTQQATAITNVGFELTSINDAVKTINLELVKIEDLLKKIEQMQYFHQWQSVDTEVKEYVIAIRTSFETYTEYIQNFADIPPAEVKELMREILNTNVGPKNGLNAISTFIIGGGGLEKGVLQLWSEMVCILVSRGLMDYRDAVDEYLSYYKKLVFAQLTATNLLMEAYNYNKDSGSGVRAFQRYKEIILSQESTCIKWLIPIINAGLVGGANPKSTLKGSYNYVVYSAASQLNPSYASLSNYTEYHNPSAVLKAAEATLSSLYCNDRNDRRIVTYMLYLGLPAMRDVLKNTEITLTKVGSAGKIIRPTVSQDLGKFDYPPSPFNTAYPDPNFNSNDKGYYIQRFVFSNVGQDNKLPDGAYRLTDLNSSGHLVPQSTYAAAYGGQGSPYGNQAVFLTNSVLNYTMLVDDTTQFDFLNFMAYNFPSPQYYNANS
jgi:hypothetical protein